jgi:hypothetical protein
MKLEEGGFSNDTCTAVCWVRGLRKERKVMGRGGLCDRCLGNLGNGSGVHLGVSKGFT